MRISDWSSDVCSSDLVGRSELLRRRDLGQAVGQLVEGGGRRRDGVLGLRSASGGQAQHRDHAQRPEPAGHLLLPDFTAFPISRASAVRSEEHTSELQSLMRISYAVFCLKKKKKQRKNRT